MFDFSFGLTKTSNNRPLHERLYVYGLWLSYLLFGLTTLGLWDASSNLLTKIELVLHIYIAVFLIYNFNPFIKKNIDDFGRNIAFSAGILLLLTKGVIKFFDHTSERDVKYASELLYDIVE